MTNPIKPTQEQTEAAKKLLEIAGRQPPSYDGGDIREAAAFLAARDAEILSAKEAEIRQHITDWALLNDIIAEKDKVITEQRDIIVAQRLRIAALTQPAPEKP